MRRGGVSVLGGVAAAACLLFAAPAGAATLIGDYQFQGTRASSGPGPVLSDIAPGPSFQTENVMGLTRQVLAFPLRTGVQMSTAGLGAGTGPYSEVTTVRLSLATAPYSYVRILDSTNGVDDTGLYSHGDVQGAPGRLDFYPENGPDYESSSTLITNDTYVTVALVVGGVGGARAYFNGAFVALYPGSYPVVADTLRFFRDEGTGAAESSAGAVSCIRVFSGALTDDEVAAIGASPTCGAPAVAPKKKCKKKKHRAAEAKKKKCKKKRKR